MWFQFSDELVVEAFHLFQSLGLHFPQHITVQFDYIRFFQLLPESFTAFYVTFVEDVPAESLDLIGYIPTFVIGNAFVDIIQQPSQNRGGRCQFFNEAVHGIAQYVGIVQFYIQVRTQFQFPCQIAHYGLEEGVDGFYTKTAVIMQHVLQCCSCCPTDVRVR